MIGDVYLVLGIVYSSFSLILGVVLLVRNTGTSYLQLKWLTAKITSQKETAAGRETNTLIYAVATANDTHAVMSSSDNLLLRTKRKTLV